MYKMKHLRPTISTAKTSSSNIEVVFVAILILVQREKTMFDVEDVLQTILVMLVCF